jgi:hypothetical protein
MLDWEGVADNLAEAVKAWNDAKKMRENMNIPFGATPLSHPEIFSPPLEAAKDANSKLEASYEIYRRFKEITHGERIGS